MWLEETAISAEVNDLPSDFLQKDVCDKLEKILPYLDQIDTKDVETAYKHIKNELKGTLWQNHGFTWLFGNLAIIFESY